MRTFINCLLVSVFVSFGNVSAQDATRSGNEKKPKAAEVYDASVPKPTLSEVQYGDHPRHVIDFWKAESDEPTPLQSLALMNNQFVLRMAKYTENHLKALTPIIEEQVKILIRLSYGREAVAQDLERALPFIENHGLAAYCRVVFNSNELLYVR